jgi:hypothetical protein
MNERTRIVGEMFRLGSNFIALWNCIEFIFYGLVVGIVFGYLLLWVFL